MGAGIICITPKTKSKKKILLSCGIHGNETAPIEIVNDLVTNLLDGTLLLAHDLMIIFGNIEAMKTQDRFIDFNLNRLFSGNWKNEREAKESVRAKEIEMITSTFFSQSSLPCFHLDLHTAIAKSHHEKFAIVPSSQDKEYTTKELAFLTSLGLDALVMEKNKTTTFSSYTQSLFGSNGLSATIELGKVYPFGENDRNNFKQAEDSLRKFLSQDNLPQSNIAKQYFVTRTLTKDHHDYKLCLTKDDINFTLLDTTKVLEVNLDGKQYPNKNEYIIFPNQNVKIGQRSGLIISNVDQYND
jgi:succinylglutamate desuccinylase